MSFYNTINLNGAALVEKIKNCNGQKQIIMEIFKRVKEMSPSQCHDIYTKVYKDAPLTSIRRAMTNLTKDGKLEKTFKQVNGIYGDPEYIWRIKN